MTQADSHADTRPPSPHSPPAMFTPPFAPLSTPPLATLRPPPLSTPSPPPLSAIPLPPALLPSPHLLQLHADDGLASLSGLGPLLSERSAHATPPPGTPPLGGPVAAERAAEAADAAARCGGGRRQTFNAKEVRAAEPSQPRDEPEARPTYPTLGQPRGPRGPRGRRVCSDFLRMLSRACSREDALEKILLRGCS